MCVREGERKIVYGVCVCACMCVCEEGGEACMQ